MIKFASVFFIFLTVAFCANVERQGEQDAQNLFMRYRYNENRSDHLMASLSSDLESIRYGEGNDDVSNKGWPQRRDYDRRSQRQRARDEQRYITSAIARWLAGSDEEYEPYEEVPYWSRYESRVEYPWEAFQFPFNY